MNTKSLYLSGLLIAGLVLHAFSQEAPIGSPAEMTTKDKSALSSLKTKVTGKIVWSTSRANSKHDIWIMNADGTDAKALTTSPNNVDWFSRFSPDGSKVLFTRSKMGWVNEMDADQHDKWDLWTIAPDGTGEQKIVSDAVWGTWDFDGKSIVFARGTKVFSKTSDSSGTETELFDAEAVFGKKKVYAQQPSRSPDQKFLCMTLRGTMRETGIYSLTDKKWYTTGAGCQIVWMPDGKNVLRMNEGQGNGGTEVLKIPLDADGKPSIKMAGLALPKEVRFMDLPGRRSHEYFPKVDNKTGKWLVWCATQTGHEHDIADYEVYIWNVETDKKKDFVRLSFHTGNDRWPDIFIQQ